MLSCVFSKRGDEFIEMDGWDLVSHKHMDCAINEWCRFILENGRTSINWQVRNSSLPFAIWRKKEREKEVQVKEMGEEKVR